MRLSDSMRLGRQGGQLAAAGDQGIGGEHAGAARVGQDRQARALRPRLGVEDLGHAEQLGDPVHAQHAAAAEGGIEHLVAAGQGPGVRRRRLGRLLGAAGLDDDDRLGQRHLARRRQEGPRVADRLHVDEDALGMRVVAEVVDQVAPADVEHRPDRDEGAEADVGPQAPVEDRGAEGPALAEEGDLARPGHGVGDRGVQAGHRAHHPEAVRADDPHPAAPRLVHDPALELLAFGPDLLESGRDDDGRPDPGLDTLADQVGHRRRGRGHDGQIDRVGHVPDAGMGFDPQHARPLRIDGEDGPAERAAEQVPHDRPADAAGLLGRPDDGDVLGREERLQAASFLGTEQVGSELLCGQAARSAHTHLLRPRSKARRISDD